MKRDTYDYEVLAGYAGRYLSRSHPWAVAVAVPFPLSCGCAVYAAYDTEDICRNVGSVARIYPGGLGQRIREHMADPAKRNTWTMLYVFPLSETTPLVEVRRLEGVIGAHLHPIDNRWLPAARPPGRSALRP